MKHIARRLLESFLAAIELAIALGLVIGFCLVLVFGIMRIENTYGDNIATGLTGAILFFVLWLALYDD